MGGMDNLEAGTGVEKDSILEVRGSGPQPEI
jgi:hypothetical protein